VATICQEGDVWQLGEHRLMCGDSTKAEDVARLMDGEKAQLVITDPPYNVAIGSKNKFLTEHGFGGGIQEDIENDKGMTDEEIGEKIWAPALKNLCDFATDDCAIYVSMPQGGTHMMMMMMMSRYWQVKHELIWLKNAPTFSMGRLNYDYKHEPIVYGWKKKHNWYAKEPKQSILCFDKPKKCDLHPTMKPIALWSELICNSSQEGMIVSDFFGGSGTTIVACEQLHRKARLMELDPHYCDVIIARWEKLTGQKAIKL
jgi:DNA modification methylase